MNDIRDYLAGTPKMGCFYVCTQSTPNGVQVGYQKAASHVFLDIFSIIQLMSFKMALSRAKSFHGLQIASQYMKKLIFCHFLMYELQNGFRMVLKPKNNYRFLKHILLPFQWHIASQDMKILILWHFLMYELQNGLKMALRVRMYWMLYLNRCWYAGSQLSRCLSEGSQLVTGVN